MYIRFLASTEMIDLEYMIKIKISRASVFGLLAHKRKEYRLLASFCLTTFIFD